MVNLFEELVLILHKRDLMPKLAAIDKEIYIHLHCHQKALVDKQVTIDALSLIPKLRVNFLNTGCCGKAGDFGIKHTQLSDKIKLQMLNIGIEFLDTENIILYKGYSCKTQLLSLCKGIPLSIQALVVSTIRINH